jgi:hypothetical protein
MFSSIDIPLGWTDIVGIDGWVEEGDRAVS